MSCRSESIAVPPEMPDPAPVDDEPSLPLSRKWRSRRRRAAKSALVVSSQVVLEDPILVVSSPVVLEDLTLVVSSPVVLEDPTLGICGPGWPDSGGLRGHHRTAQFHCCCHRQEGHLCLWPLDCSACMGAFRVHSRARSSPGAFSVHSRARSSPGVHSWARSSSSRGGGFCCRTSRGSGVRFRAVAPTPELSVCPVTAKETVAERSACPFMAVRAVTNLSLQSYLSR